jgi:hypothetical protein
MNTKTTLTRVYAAIAGIPLAAILFASAIGGGGSAAARYYDYARESAGEPSSGVTLDADAYSSLGKYNPCIFIACEGE